MLTLFVFHHSAHAETVVLVTPQEKDTKAILSIVDGIKRSASDSSVVPVDSLADYMINENDRLIVLGSSLVSQSSTLPDDFPAIGGGFYSHIDNLRINTLSLYPDIKSISSEIVKTGFALKRIVTVTNSQQLKKYIESSLSETNYEVDVLLAASEQTTARAWFELLRDLNPIEDAILISDATFLERSGSYRKILESAWIKDLLVVSALPQYSTRGVSAGYVPDLSAYGEQLYSLLNGTEYPAFFSRKSNRNVTVDVLVRIFNQRTLEHIGYSLPDDLDELNGDDVVIK